MFNDNNEEETLIFPKGSIILEDPSSTPINHPPDLMVVGVLIELEGDEAFYCVECGKRATHAHPILSHQVVFYGDIYPQSQACHRCNLQVVNGELGMPEKYWKPIPNTQRLTELLNEVERLGSYDPDDALRDPREGDTLQGICPPLEDAITLVNIVDFDDLPTLTDLSVHVG